MPSHEDSEWQERNTERELTDALCLPLLTDLGDPSYRDARPLLVIAPSSARSFLRKGARWPLLGDVSTGQHVAATECQRLFAGDKHDGASGRANDAQAGSR